MSRIVAASVLALALGAAPVLAQPSSGTPQRNVAPTGVTKPPGRAEAGKTPYTRASTEGDMAKAQRASAARDKAWDTKMRTTMGSICKGC
ncbi:hypothetical protein ASF49_04910 [Methylobacterium sp. Leaf104]|uniref:hypothetical protein n=1 Tax=Methylobacterium TaxID=407 RepID=UPI0006F75064|nr:MULTISPECIES: hypothetical protein [Methylobacterium]KQP38346.1 hypothetical protein ASF49_04910 [Methylobacterium sp. Leaf104]MCI9880250.1 hypothetical protein [Methylobacterium goesingense]